MLHILRERLENSERTLHYATLGIISGLLVGACANLISPELTSPIGFYALLGIACSMGAILNAPLAAIIAIIELT